MRQQTKQKKALLLLNLEVSDRMKDLVNKPS